MVAYQNVLKPAKYVDLTHTITPCIPVWAGFAGSTFAPAQAGADIEGMAKKGEIFTYGKDGFEATQYVLRTDQLGTQLDPPAHWAPEYPAIDELPPTYAVRPLAVISVVEQVEANPNYALTVADIERWEAGHGRLSPSPRLPTDYPRSPPCSSLSISRSKIPVRSPAQA